MWGSRFPSEVFQLRVLFIAISEKCMFSHLPRMAVAHDVGAGSELKGWRTAWRSPPKPNLLTAWVGELPWNLSRLKHGERGVSVLTAVSRGSGTTWPAPHGSFLSLSSGHTPEWVPLSLGLGTSEDLLG